MKKILCLFLTVLVLTSCVTSTEAKEYESFSWYVKREKNHCQPGIETEMQSALANDGYYIDKNHGKDSTDKVVYLTFDAGYENGNVKKILDTLKEENVKGAFFILSHLIHAEPDLVTRMEKEGHLVCN
ncbi:MAG: polysaccharide deacetylase family protein, partial [Clostridia bacterium]|nr:polysaccharide deacetylase family protein [Clostridia bacterium]